MNWHCLVLHQLYPTLRAVSQTEFDLLPALSFIYLTRHQITSNMSSTMTRDPYGGYGPISILSSSIVTALFPPTVSSQRQSPVATETDRHMPQLVDFIAYALYRTRLSDAIVHSALLLLTRLKQRYPAARGTPSSPHRLFLSALMLASKMSMDDTYANKSWVIVGQNLFSLSEVNRMERELFGFLNSNCYVTKDDLASWCHEWCGYTDEEDVDEVYQSDDTSHTVSRSITTSSSAMIDCHSSDSNSPISCSTTTSSSPSPRTPDEGSEAEQEVHQRWSSINQMVGRIAPSNNVKSLNHAHSTASIQHILNSPL